MLIDDGNAVASQLDDNLSRAAGSVTIEADAQVNISNGRQLTTSSGITNDDALIMGSTRNTTRLNFSGAQTLIGTGAD